LFNAFGIEGNQSPVPHVEGDNGSRIVDDVPPKGGILIVDMFDDEDGVGCVGPHGFFAALGSLLSLSINNDDWLLAKVIANAEELLLLGGVEVLFLIGIVWETLEKDIADEFVCPRRLHTKPAPMYGAGWSGD
jgi:hypothetical protein